MTQNENIQVEERSVQDKVCYKTRFEKIGFGVMPFEIDFKNVPMRKIDDDEMAVIFHEKECLIIEVPVYDEKSVKEKYFTIIMSELAFLNMSEAISTGMESLPCRDLNPNPGERKIKSFKIPKYVMIEQGSFYQFQAKKGSYSALVAIDFKKNELINVSKTAVMRIVCSENEIDLMEKIDYEEDHLEQGRIFLTEIENERKPVSARDN
jgi:hypothetical protein